jgi:hypothetical protein
MKRWLAFNGLRGVTSQKLVLFIYIPVYISIGAACFDAKITIKMIVKSVI